MAIWHALREVMIDSLSRSSSIQVDLLTVAQGPTRGGQFLIKMDLASLQMDTMGGGRSIQSLDTPESFQILSHRGQ